MENQNFCHEPKATDGFTTTEKIKAVLPGTAEHRAKKAAQDRLDGELPHSTIQQVDQMDQIDQGNMNKIKDNLPLDKPTDGLSTGEKLKAKLPGTKEHKAKELNEKQNFHHEPKATDGFTTAEKMKAELPGTAEHRAKEAAQERLNGQLPHSIIGELENRSVPKVKKKKKVLGVESN